MWLDHTFPEFKPFFHERISKTALYLLENYGSAEKMARMNSVSYEKLRSVSKGKFSPQKFLAKEIDNIEMEITKLLEEVHPHYMSIPGIGPLSAAVIYSEYGVYLTSITLVKCLLSQVLNPE